MIQRSSMKDATPRFWARANGVSECRGEIVIQGMSFLEVVSMQQLPHKSAEVQMELQNLMGGKNQRKGSRNTFSKLMTRFPKSGGLWQQH